MTPVALEYTANVRCECMMKRFAKVLWWLTASVVTSDDYCPGAYGQLMELPESCMSRMSVSMGVFPTSLMKKS